MQMIMSLRCVYNRCDVGGQFVRLAGVFNFKEFSKFFFNIYVSLDYLYYHECL